MVAKNNTVRITQPYQGDRGSLRVLVEAENLPAGAYGELEPVFEAAERWAEKWLSSTTGDGGKELMWWETRLRDLPIETRAKNPLIRRFGAEAELAVLLDQYDSGDGKLHGIMRIPGFGESSYRALMSWVHHMEEVQGVWPGDEDEEDDE